MPVLAHNASAAPELAEFPLPTYQKALVGMITNLGQQYMHGRVPHEVIDAMNIEIEQLLLLIDRYVGQQTGRWDLIHMPELKEAQKFQNLLLEYGARNRSKARILVP